MRAGLVSDGLHTLRGKEMFCLLIGTAKAGSNLLRGLLPEGFLDLASKGFHI